MSCDIMLGMRAIWIVPVIVGILILGSLGLSQGVFAQTADLLTDPNVNTPPTILETPPIPGDTAPAFPIDIIDFSGSETVIGFETLPSTPPPGPFSIGDVTFSEFSTGSGGPGWRLATGTGLFGTPDPQLTDNAGISLIRLDFSSPVNRVGMIVGVGPANYEVRFFNSALTLIETVPISAPQLLDGAFAGIESAELISRVEIVEVSAENGLVGGIDDVRFELVAPIGGTLVPIDTTALLLASVQSIWMWMIPVVAAGIVIGVFVIKRRK